MEDHETRIAGRQISVLAILIVTAATPATLALSYYLLTGDPSFRPMAITLERLVANDQNVGQMIVRADVHTSGSAIGIARGEAFAKMLSASLAGKGIDAFVTVDKLTRPGPPTAFFVVGQSTNGPFDAATAPSGIRTVAEAIRLRRR